MQFALLPMPLVSAVFVVLGLGVVVGISHAAHRLGRRKAGDESRVDVVEVAKLIGGILALFMVFVMSQCMNYYRSAEIAVAKEAGDILQLDRALAGVSPALGDPARVRLREYVRSIIDQEWPAMQRGKFSDETEHRLDLLQEAVNLAQTGDPATAAFRNVQKNLDDVEDDRIARLGSAQSGVPAALWWTIEAIAAMLAICLFQFGLGRAELLGFAPYLASLLLLAALLFMIDGPFSGSLHVEAEPLQRMLGRLVAS